MAVRALLLLAASLLVAAPAATAATIALERVLSLLARPVYVTAARDGTNRLFVVEQRGVIKVLRPGASEPTTFLDIVSRVRAGGEQGLLGLAFHPRYAVNRRFFVNYTRAPDGATVVAAYRASAGNPDVASTAETVLLVIPQPFASHNGGMIEFGSDGFLYIATGDGGSQNDPDDRGQDVGDLLGKVLRIDVDRPNGAVPYSSPPDNPFAGSITGRDEIYAYGFRNPWRFSFDRGTGELYLGDVGQGSREEIDIVTRGGNYGWRVFEGTRCTGLDPASCGAPGFTPPILEYEHTLDRCSITGGYVYRGARSTLPAGAYVFADFCTGEIFQLAGGVMTRRLRTNLRIASFGEDEAGEIYVVGVAGSVDRIRPAPAPAPCTYAILAAARTFDARARTGSFAMSAGPDCGWMAASHAPWITLSAATSGVGDGTVEFSVAANTGATSRTSTISAGGRTLTITQAAPALRALRLSASNVAGCTSVTGTVVLNAPAPAGGAVVALSDTLAAADVPASVTVAAGATTGSFTIATTRVTAGQAGEVTATLGTMTRTASLRVRPVGVAALTLSPNPVTGPASVTGSATLDCAAGAGGIVVTLASDNPAVAAPTATSITIPAGARRRTFTVQTTDVAGRSTASIRATAHGIGKTSVLTVR